VSGGLEVRGAGRGDVDEIVEVLSEAARWLMRRGIRQWPDPFPRDRVEALVARGDFYVAKQGGETVGTLALMWSDPVFWGEQPADAGYVHALAVRRAWAGRGLGARLLEWAGEQVAAAGRRYLRLDCRAENVELRRYYERHGFEPRGEVEVDDFTSALYERRCGPVAAAEPGHDSASSRSVGKPAQSRHEPVTDTREMRSYARSGSEGGPITPPIEGGGALGGRDGRPEDDAVSARRSAATPP
jgi:ribosomal protein S18 acetylase RimI-like enzyme